eukprot:1119930-Rhodomonas_salina.1
MFEPPTRILVAVHVIRTTRGGLCSMDRILRTRYTNAATHNLKTPNERGRRAREGAYSRDNTPKNTSNDFPK